MLACLSNSFICCPYCGESLEILIDSSAGNQSYVEDCQVCCAPIELSVQIAPNGEVLSVEAIRDSD